MKNLFKFFLPLIFFSFFGLLFVNNASADSLHWIEKSPMPTARWAFNAVTTADGNIYAIGGYSYALNPSYVVANEEYNPTTDTWTTRSSMPVAISGPATVGANNGKIYVFGGGVNDPTTNYLTNIVQEYDPSTDAWTMRTPIPTKRQTAAVLGNDGKIYVIGGATTTGTITPTNVVEAYDPTTDTWTTRAPMPTAREDLALAVTPTGKIYAIGGTADNINALNIVEEYDIATNTWTTRTPMPTARWGLRTLTAENGKLYAIGGLDAHSGCCSDYSTVEEYNPIADSWATSDNMLLQLVAPGATLGTNGKIYVMGGSNSYGIQQTNIVQEATIIASNQPPVPSSLSNEILNEGAAYSAAGSFTDTDSTSWIGTVDYGDGLGVTPLTLNLDKTFNLSHVYQEEGTYIVTVKVTDNQGATGTTTATISVNNAPFTIGAITAPTTPTQLGNVITASASITDQGALDTHTASWNWGDGNATTGTVTESNGTGIVSDTHMYTATGVYTITLTVTDDDGVAQTSTFQYLSVYNPTSQGLFSAGSKYTSPAGAYIQNTNLTGDVKFGLSYKYQGSMPVGDKQFTMNFKAANLAFNATTVSSLVISNGVGTLTGTGTINGSGTYNFLVTGNESANTIRIQITDSSNNVIYDTQLGNPATATPTTPVSGHVLAH